MLDIKLVREAIDHEITHVVDIATETLGSFETSLPIVVLVGVTRDPQDAAPLFQHNERPGPEAPAWASDVQFIPVTQRYEGPAGIGELVNRARALALAGDAATTIMCMVTPAVVTTGVGGDDAEIERLRAKFTEESILSQPDRKEVFVAFVEYAGRYSIGPEFHMFKVERDQGQCEIEKIQGADIAVPIHGAPRIIPHKDFVAPEAMMKSAFDISREIIDDICNGISGNLVDDPIVVREGAQ